MGIFKRGLFLNHFHLFADFISLFHSCVRMSWFGHIQGKLKSKEHATLLVLLSLPLICIALGALNMDCFFVQSLLFMSKLLSHVRCILTNYSYTPRNLIDNAHATMSLLLTFLSCFDGEYCCFDVLELLITLYRLIY